MVFTESEVEAASRPPTLEERDRHAVTARATRPSGPPPEQVAAASNAGASRASEAVNTLGVANDTTNTINSLGLARQTLPTGYRGPFLPRTGPNGAHTQLPVAPSRVNDLGSGALGIVGGLAQVANSAYAGTRPGVSTADRNQALLGVGVGTSGALGGVSTMASNNTGSGLASIAAGGFEMAQGILNLRSNDVGQQGAGGQQLLHGGLTAGGGVATLAGATTLAPVLAAGGLGVSIGTTLQQRADARSLESGRYTEQRVGRGVNGETSTHAISASDQAARAGVADGESARRWLQETTGWGGLADVGGFAAGGVSTIGRSIWNTFTNLW